MGNPGREINRLVKSHREWLQESGSEVFDYTTQRMTAKLSEASLPALRCMKSSLDSFGTCYGIKGVVGLADNNPSAWEDIYLGCSFHLHEIRLHYALWTRLGDEPGFTLETNKVACALCFSLANGFSDWARLFTEMVSQAEWNDQMVKRVYWQERKFEPFALRLSQIDASNGANVPTSSDSMGVYSGLLSHWNSPELFAQAIEAVCDYHCENMEDKGGDDDWDPEFDLPPFDLIPWEILAIRQVRSRLGLATPEPKHPLLEYVSSFVAQNELPADDRISAVEDLREKLGMTVKE